MVWIHGGPTACSTGLLDMEKAYFTSRGIGIIDVNYGGSTGFGRLYRERLRRGPLPVGELAARLPVGRPAVSKHLRVLEGAGLVEHRSVGTRNLYALAPAGFVALQQWLVMFQM